MKSAVCLSISFHAYCQTDLSTDFQKGSEETPIKGPQAIQIPHTDARNWIRVSSEIDFLRRVWPSHWNFKGIWGLNEKKTVLESAAPDFLLSVRITYSKELTLILFLHKSYPSLRPRRLHLRTCRCFNTHDAEQQGWRAHINNECAIGQVEITISDQTVSLNASYHPNSSRE